MQEILPYGRDRTPSSLCLYLEISEAGRLIDGKHVMQY